MADPTRAVRAAAQIDADLATYCRTLTHAEALHCIDYLGTWSAKVANFSFATSDREFRQVMPLVGLAQRLLARRAARTRPERPGGRAAYNHDDCSCTHDLMAFLSQLETRLAQARRDLL